MKFNIYIHIKRIDAELGQKIYISKSFIGILYMIYIEREKNGGHNKKWPLRGFK